MAPTAAGNPFPSPGALDEKGFTPAASLWKLWIYTNYDCNLKCSYCVARSGPTAPRRALGMARVQRLVDEAAGLGFADVFFTGGEPLLLEDIYEMLTYSASRIKTTVLTNAMLLRGTRLERLAATQRSVPPENLIVQVSLDGGRSEDHDAYRGPGSWEKTVEGIRLLQERGFRVRIGTTETPVNSPHLGKICEFHRRIEIPDRDHFIRPLAKRGYSREGLELGMHNLMPEVTVNLEGVFWHPLATEADMQVSRELFPLSAAVEKIRVQLATIERTGSAPRMTFT
jgi:MoaA/NifB/PqqE/SkfB family radical SAM enzyme